ncbi:hypothetical protein BZG36_02742 [Bifiguratus adelaidae]|uniref:PHD-type domain-containing protein n=1 Tax=Bifiguratus adelaidae TaxID=1938954 RepID=A0A261XYM7_9FUNG|nr:hypothetical protein BZG36_02742 [Bifiguratus adelaidae]
MDLQASPQTSERSEFAPVVQQPRKRGRPRIYPRPGDENFDEGELLKKFHKGVVGSPVVQTWLPDGQDDGQEEVIGEVEEAGEKKITRNGELLGGRKFLVPVFQLPSRGPKWYMLSMDPAKVLGFRDSYIFFNKNPDLRRIWATEEEKNAMIEKGWLMPIFRTRGIAMITARSIFRLFGHKIIKHGKPKRDDYYESIAILNGYTEDPSDSEHDSDDSEGAGMHVLPRINHIVRHEQRPEYNTFNPLSQNKNVNDKNWMYYSALAVSEMNKRLRISRLERATFFDVHTGLEQVKASTQPTEVYVDFESPMGVSFKKEPTNDSQDHDPSDESHYIRSRVNCTNGPEDFPLAIMPGQYQANIPVHNKRFDEEEYRRKQAILAEIRAKEAAEAQKKAEGEQLLNAMSAAEAAATHQTCGVLTRNGTACKRLVANAGDKCILHKDVNDDDSVKGEDMNGVIAQQLPYDPNLCAYCRTQEAPKELIPESGASCDVTQTHTCIKCGQKYHPFCAHLSTSRQITAIESYKWDCPECKICSVCQSSGDESKLIICDDCDRSTHTDCCNPKVEEVPQDSWLCALCNLCYGCGKATDIDNTSHTLRHAVAPPSDDVKYPVYIATYCRACMANFKDDRFCPCCLKTWKEDEEEQEDNPMVCCDTCERWIHSKCDSQLTAQRYQQLAEDETQKYFCPLCSNRYKTTVHTAEARAAMGGKSIGAGFVVGEVGGRVRVRGLTKYKGWKVALPEIHGTGEVSVPS